MSSRAKALHDEALQLRPEGAEHDSDLCPFCRQDVAESDGTPSGSGRPEGSAATGSDASTEGGTRHLMSDMTKETHEQLLNAAVAQAKAEAATEITGLKSQNETLTAENASLKADTETKTTEIATLTSENTRLNGELDTAQVALKASQDEVATLKGDLDKRDEEAAKQEVATKRADQVKNLGLFQEDYIAAKSGDWASLSDEDWAARVDEWKNLRGDSAPSGGDSTTDTASALTGSRSDDDTAASSNGGGGGDDKVSKGRSATRRLLQVG